MGFRPWFFYRSFKMYFKHSCVHLLSFGGYNFLPLAPLYPVPRDSIRALWQEFNLHKENWGIEPAFFEQLCQALAKSMDTESSETANTALFSAFDKDKVGIRSYFSSAMD